MVSDFGFEALPPEVRSSSLTMKWLKSRSYRYKAKKALDQFHYGLSDMSMITPKGYKQMLILSGEKKEVAQRESVRLYLKRQDNA